MKPKLETYTVSSGYGGNTRRPFVEIVAPKLRITMSSAEARALALNILEASVAADADGFLINFFVKEIEIGQREAAGLLMKFREYRASVSDDVDAA
jgi:hypothetical protein